MPGNIDIVGVLGLILTLGVYAYFAWRRFRKPRFWITFAEMKLQSLPRGSAGFGPNPMLIAEGRIAFAFVGGGTPRNIIDATLVYEGQGGTSISLPEVIHVPAELSGRNGVEISPGRVINATEELPCVLRLQDGHQIFEVPFTFRLHGSDRYYCTSTEMRLDLLEWQLPKSELGRWARRVRRMVLAAWRQVRGQ